MSWYRHHSCVHSTCLTSTSFTSLWFSARHCRQFQDAKVQSLPSGHLALYINSCYSMTCGTENICIAALEASSWGIISTWRKERMAKASQKRFCFSWKLEVDQEFLRGWRHSRLKELYGHRQAGKELHRWFGDGHPVKSGCKVAYVAEMDYFVEPFPNFVLGSTGVPQDGYEYFKRKGIHKEKKLHAQKYLGSPELCILPLVRHSIYWHVKAAEISCS